MDNSQILGALEKQRDDLFNKLNSQTISGLYQETQDAIKAGKLFITVNDVGVEPDDLLKFCQDTSLDESFKEKVNSIKLLDDANLIEHFKTEFERILEKLSASIMCDQIQAMFIEYYYYYDYSSYITCYGRQNYPIVETPRYISNEYDYKKQIMWIEKGINFQPAWPGCEEFDDLRLLEVGYEIQDLFRFHSFTLLHKAILSLTENGQLDFLVSRPFSIYINEHDCEVMMLYRLT